MKKRILSILLAVIMTVSLLPGTAFAAAYHSDPAEHSAQSWTAISDLAGLKDFFANGGRAYLTADIEADGALTVSAASQVHLCLSGHVLDLAGKGNITVTDGTTFYLYDCEGTTEHRFGENSDGLWTWDDTLTGSDVKHTVTGGIITGGRAVWGGGVNSNDGHFHFAGGSIVGCCAAAAPGGAGGGGTPSTPTGESTFRGGAVYNADEFTMSGGKIFGCVSSETGGAIFNTGAIKLNSGVLIDSCTAKNGGALYHTGTENTTLRSTSIRNCSATGAAEDGQGYGGGIYIAENASIVMKDSSTIERCSATVFGGGVFNAGTFGIKDDNSAINYCSAEKGGAVHLNGGSGAMFNFEGGSMSCNTATRTGSAVQNSEGATFNFISGIITGNTVGDPAGGAVFSKGTLNLEGSVTVKNNNNSETPTNKSNIVLGSSTARITLSGELAAGYLQRIGVFHAKKNDDGIYVPDPDSLNIIDGGVTEANYLYFISDDPHSAATHFWDVGDGSLTLEEDPDYMAIGGVPVNDDNATDIFGDGKASYDPATNTLTLNGVSLTTLDAFPIPHDEVSSANDLSRLCVYAPRNLNLVISGSNTISMQSSNTTGSGIDEYGIFCGGHLTLSGDGTLTFNVTNDDYVGDADHVAAIDANPASDWSAPHVAKALIYATDSVTVNGGTYGNTGLPWSAIRSRNITVNDGLLEFGSYGHCLYSENFSTTQPLLDEKIAVNINGGVLKLRDDRYNPTYMSNMELGAYSVFGQKDVFVNGGKLNILSHNGICGDRVVIKGNSTEVGITNNEPGNHHVSTKDVGILAEWSWIKLEDGCKVSIDVVDRDDHTKSGNNFVLKGGAVTYNDLTEKADTKLTAPDSKLYLNGKPVIFFVYPEGAPYTKAHTSLQAYIDAVGEETTTIALPDNITEKITIAANQNITLDLNGYTLSGGCGSTAAEDGHVIVNNGSLTIMDSSVPSTGKITGGNAFYGGAILCNGYTMLTSGTITGCKAASDNYDPAYSKLGRGGAVYVPADGIFEMRGGTIDSCSASVAGGAIYSWGMVEMKGGRITGCSVSGLSDGTAVKAKGGAVYLMDGAKMNASGGEISGNTLGNVTDMRGAGVYAGTNTMVCLGGTAKITGNKDGNGTGKDSNLFLYDGVKVSVAPAPQSGMKIGVTTKTAPTDGAPVAFTLDGASGHTQYFTPDDSSMTVKFVTDHLELAVKPAESNGGGSGRQNYSVTVKTAENGTVTADKKSAAAGDTVTVTVTPNTGFTLDKLTVLNKSNKEVTVKNLGSNKFSFTMPESNVTVSATFKKNAVTSNPFVDVTETDYFHDAVLWAAENGITSGMDATHFVPREITTRAQMVTFLWRASGSPEPTVTSCAFTDLENGAYYCKAILWAVEQGITVGTTATTFSPYVPVSRAQAVTFLARMNGVADEAVDFAHSFTDVYATDYFNNAVAWAAASGITEGTTATTFSPHNNCLRGQIVTFLYRNFVK